MSSTSSMTSSTTPAFRLTYAKDSRGHSALSYPYSSTTTDDYTTATPQLSRLHYAKDSRGHTSLRYPYSSSTSMSQSSFSAASSSRHSLDSNSDDEERQSLTATEDSMTNYSSSLYTGADGQFRGIYDRSQSTNLVKLALRGSKRRAN